MAVEVEVHAELDVHADDDCSTTWAAGVAVETTGATGALDTTGSTAGAGAGAAEDSGAGAGGGAGAGTSELDGAATGGF